jgi:hypothetical protein
VSGSRLARTLALVRWSQMGFLLRAIFGPVRTTASSRPRGPDRQVLEERASLFSHAHKDNSLSFTSYPLGLITTRFVPLLCASYMAKRKVTAEELLTQAESNGYKRGANERKMALEMTRDT